MPKPLGRQETHRSMKIGLTCGIYDSKHAACFGGPLYAFGWCVRRQLDCEGHVLRGKRMTYAAIAEEMGAPERSVRRWLGVLVKDGYISIDGRRGSGVRIKVLNPKKRGLIDKTNDQRPDPAEVADLRPDPAEPMARSGHWQRPDPALITARSGVVSTIGDRVEIEGEGERAPRETNLPSCPFELGPVLQLAMKAGILEVVTDWLAGWRSNEASWPHIQRALRHKPEVQQAALVATVQHCSDKNGRYPDEWAAKDWAEHCTKEAAKRAKKIGSTNGYRDKDWEAVDAKYGAR